jgi:ribosomal protein S18 acetylase RimI-like enzyme
MAIQMTEPDQGRLQPPHFEHTGPVAPFCVRRGRISDASAIALLAHAAGGDVLQFILGGLSQSSAALDVYQEMVREPGGIYSFERCVVAVAGNAVVGMANAFPAGLIRNEYPVRNPTSRDVLLKPRFELNDWKSYLLNNICVGPDHRRGGVGTALLKAVVRDARREGHASVTLHVWADNHGAVAFYRRFGFRQRGRAQIPWHIDLPHEGGSLLMKLPLRTAPDVPAFQDEDHA